MNELKRRTSRERRAWDLDVPQYVNIRNRRKLEAILKRKARRTMKQELLPEIHEAWELLGSRV